MDKKDKVAIELGIALGLARSLFNKSFKIVKGESGSIPEICSISQELIEQIKYLEGVLIGFGMMKNK